MDIKKLQEQLPWLSKYSREFEASPSWRHFGHAVLHVGKVIGHLAELVDEMDHNGQDFVDANSVGFLRDYGKYIADLVILAVRLANEFPGGRLDLERLVADRIAEKNAGTVIKGSEDEVTIPRADIERLLKEVGAYLEGNEHMNSIEVAFERVDAGLKRARS